MGKIKSALEIALERTESVKSDKVTIGHFEAKQKGKKLANQFIEGTIKSEDRKSEDLKSTDLRSADRRSLQDEIKKAPPDEQASLKRGMFDALVSQITLPNQKG